MVKQEAMALLRHWAMRKHELEQVNTQFRSTLPQERSGTLGRLDFFLLEEIPTKAGHTDTAYVSDLARGFSVPGALDTGGLGTVIPGGQRVNQKPGLGGPEDVSGNQ